jgi:hypothetical protein
VTGEPVYKTMTFFMQMLRPNEKLRPVRQNVANWPNALSAACDSLTPRLKDGSVDRHREAAVGLAEAEAERILAALAIAGHGPQIPEQALTALESFVAHVIPEMLPIGIALEASLMPKPSS